MGRVYVPSTPATRGEEVPEPEVEAVELDLDNLSEEQLEQLKGLVDEAAALRIEELEAKVNELTAELEAKAVAEPDNKSDDKSTVTVQEPVKGPAPARADAPKK